MFHPHKFRLSFSQGCKNVQQRNHISLELISVTDGPSPDDLFSPPSFTVIRLRFHHLMFYFPNELCYNFMDWSKSESGAIKPAVKGLYTEHLSKTTHLEDIRGLTPALTLGRFIDVPPVDCALLFAKKAFWEWKIRVIWRHYP